MSRKRIVTLALAGFCLAGCGGSAAAAPSGVSPSGPPLPPPYRVLHFGDAGEVYAQCDGSNRVYLDYNSQDRMVVIPNDPGCAG